MTTVVEDTIEPGSNSYLVSGVPVPTPETLAAYGNALLALLGCSLALPCPQALTKGASEKVLTFCSTYLDSDGNERVLDDGVSAAAVQEALC